MSLSDITRHNTAKSHYLGLVSQLSESLEQEIAGAVKNPRALHTALTSARENALMSLSLDPEFRWYGTWEAWVTWEQVAESVIATGRADEGSTVTRRLHHRLRELPAVPPSPVTGAETWFQAVFLAVICRDEERVRSLCSVPAPFLWSSWRLGEQFYAEHVCPRVSALQDFLLGRPEFHHNLNEALQHAQPPYPSYNSYRTDADPEQLEMLVVPELRVLQKLAERDTAGFDTAMAEALRSFRDFHTASPERSESVDGAVPLSLLALACLAYDTHRQDPEFTPDLNSAYFPLAILKRVWENVFPLRTGGSQTESATATAAATADAGDNSDSDSSEPSTIVPPAQTPPEPPVERHDATGPGQSELTDDLWEDIEKIAQRLEEDPHSVLEARATLKRWALANLAVDTRGSYLMTWEAWSGWMQVTGAFFAMSTAPAGTTVERFIHHKTRTLHAIDPGPGFDTEHWLEAFYLALTFRADERALALARVPVPLLWETGQNHGVECDDYLHYWAAALQDYVLDSPDLGENLLAAMEQSTPEHARHHDQVRLDWLAFPPMNALLQLAKHDSAEFNDAVRVGLLRFRDYYTADESRRTDLDGVVPQALLAIATLAQRLGRGGAVFTPDLRSDYFPATLLDYTMSSRFEEIPV